MTPRDNRKSGPRGKPAEGPFCPSCGATTASEDRFCHSCGASLEGRSDADRWSVGRLAGLGAVAGLIAIAVFAVVAFAARDRAPRSSVAPPAPLFGVPPPAASGGPLDPSQMTPREVADRLFNRIMMAREQGQSAEALRLVPMAVQAYDDLPVLDRDARYHLGLINLVAGDGPKVDQQIALLRQAAPDHLLALALEHDAAIQSGDRATVSSVLSAFAAAYDAEMATGRPEYEAHRDTIERIRAAAEPAK